MKTKHFSIFIILITIILFSCKRYGDDPLTLRTPLNRITGTWEMTKYEIDGVDSLGLIRLINTKFIYKKEFYQKKGKYRIINSYGYVEQGYWKFEGKNNKIRSNIKYFPIYGATAADDYGLYPEGYGNSSYLWDIEKLTKEEMTLYLKGEFPVNTIHEYRITFKKLTENTDNDF